jgi:hypothetical protein
VVQFGSKVEWPKVESDVAQILIIKQCDRITYSRGPLR